jgi:hypothetical protein
MQLRFAFIGKPLSCSDKSKEKASGVLFLQKIAHMLTEWKGWDNFKN